MNAKEGDFFSWVRVAYSGTHLAKSNQWSKPQPAVDTADGSGRGRSLRHTLHLDFPVGSSGFGSQVFLHNEANYSP